MIRGLFTIASLISLLLFIATALMWRQAHRVPTRYLQLSYQPDKSIYGQTWIDNTRGMISVGYLRETLTDPELVAWAERQNKAGKFGRSTLP